jgi:hypothetical protein
MSRQKFYLVDLSPDAHAKLKSVSVRTGRKMKEILSNMVLENLQYVE